MRNEDDRGLEPMATEVVGKLEQVATAAQAWLKNQKPLGIDALANVGNTLNSDRAARALDAVNQANENAYRKLATEPAIARVIVEDEEGKRAAYYFCRADQGMVGLGVVSYRAPVGRLAALPVGDEYFRDGQSLVVVEREQLRPSPAAGLWDAHTVVQSEGAPTVTIESLRKLLERHPELVEAVDLVAQILANEESKQNVIEGIRRSRITKMGLRDQPVLDKFQDEIFRLPLARRVLLLGPPGTGKTTTLIRRLGQKLDGQFLDEDEQRVVEELAQSQQTSHGKSWVMFTPTELLKQYLKEAFNREDIPAPDQNIRTWADHRRDLARQTFGVLRTANGGGTFVLKEALPSLQAAAQGQPIDWYSDFHAWHGQAYRQELLDAAQALVASSAPAAGQLGQRLEAVLQAGDAWPVTFAELAREVGAVQGFAAQLKEETDGKIKAALNRQLARNKDLLSELARLIESRQQASQEGDADDEQDGDEDEDAGSAPRVGAAAAINAYMQAVRTQARNAAAKRSTNKTTRNGKIIDWLGDRTLPAAELATLGASLILQTHARRFVNPVKRYVDGIPKRYRAFRRLRQEEGRWYAKAGFESRDLHPLELDVVLLAMLRSAGELLQRSGVLRDIDTPAWSSLQPAVSALRSQVVVDEAADFSPIQLACMAALAHPRLRSFFACGDFNQRLTTWGSRSAEELQWVFPDFDIRHITVTYRQSRQLNELARDIIRCTGGPDQEVTLPSEVDNEGEPPALLERAKASEVIAWLAAQIREIERSLGQLPSTAIFVNSEAEVEPTAQALNAALAEQNIQVMACREGQAVGVESNVRVFDVQHIKGLEFEAVFFVGIDQLAADQPDLFDKFIYVGATRAAQYLGLTCADQLPTALEPLRKHFVERWEALAPTPA